MGDRALLWLHHRPIARAVSSAPLVTGAFYSEAAPFGSCVTGAASHIGNKFGQMGVDLLREFHVAPVLRRVWCCGSCECHRSHCDRSDDQARSKPFLAAMAVAKRAQVLKGHLSRWL